ncbi:hypothetical protein GCM10020220_039200 [Nonomuraea rubra]
MVEVDATLELIGPHGPVSLLDAFEGRRQLIAYYFMWNPGRPAAEQCEGCTFYTTQIGEQAHLHSRDITFAVLCQGRNVASGGADPQASYEASLRYRDFMGWQLPWYSAQPSLDALLAGRQAGLFHLICYLRDGDRVFETYWTTRRGVEAMDHSYALMDLTAYGRQEPWEGLAGRPPAGVHEPAHRRRPARLARGGLAGRTAHRPVAPARRRTLRRPRPRGTAAPAVRPLPLAGTPDTGPASSELVVPGQVLPADGAKGRIGAVARRDVRGGLEPHDGEGGAVQHRVVVRGDRRRAEGADAGHGRQHLDGPNPPAVRSGYSRAGGRRWTGVAGKARSAARRSPPITMSLTGLHG